MMLDIATVADYATVFSLVIAITSMVLNMIIRSKVNKITTMKQDIKINSMHGDLNTITGNSPNVSIKERIKK